MGTTAALKELEAETLFSEEKVDGPLVKGIVASERTFLAQSSERLVLRKLVESFSNDDDAKKLSLACKKISSLKSKSRNLELVGQLLSRLKKGNIVSASYKHLLDELWKCTPIAQLFPSNNKKNLKTFEAFLRKENHCFDTLEGATSLTESFPLPVKLIRQIQNDEGCLPSDVANIFQAMIDLRRAYSTLAQERSVPRIKPNPGHKGADSEIYPIFPLHTMDNNYEIDYKRSQEDNEESEKGCNKDYNQSSTISGGITHVTCQHSITKGFTAMRKGESPMMAVGMSKRRL